jgi:hypothetical protein
MGDMDPDEQIRIERELRQKLAKPKYLPIFDLPQAHVVKSKERVLPPQVGLDRCPSQARSEETTSGAWGGNGIVNRQTAHCVLRAGHMGPHMTESFAMMLTKKLGHWQWD